MKYNDLNLGQIEAIANKLGGMHGIEKLLRDELVISEKAKKWYEKDGVIYFTVTSDGATGEEWISRLESKSFVVEDNAKRTLRSSDFKSTSGITYEIAVLKDNLFNDNEIINEKIRQKAMTRQFTTPNAEVACLIREKFSYEELKAMGLNWVAVMHEPIKDTESEQMNLLQLFTTVDGSCLYALPHTDKSWWRPWKFNNGFAFVSQKEVA